MPHQSLVHEELPNFIESAESPRFDSHREATSAAPMPEPPRRRPLWVAYGANLGTLLRTCDAVGACMAIPETDHYREALKKGDTLTQRPCIHWVERSSTGLIVSAVGVQR